MAASPPRPSALPRLRGPTPSSSAPRCSVIPVGSPPAWHSAAPTLPRPSGSRRGARSALSPEESEPHYEPRHHEHPRENRLPPELRQRPRYPLHQPDSHAGRRCRAEGQLGPPGGSDGPRPRGVRPLAPLSQAQPRQPSLARPGPLRALGGPSLDAPLLPPVPY